MFIIFKLSVNLNDEIINKKKCNAVHQNNFIYIFITFFKTFSNFIYKNMF